jgi:DNA-binding CsgD family transcriptional regulator
MFARDDSTMAILDQQIHGAERRSRHSPRAHRILTDRESEVLARVKRGLSNKLIAYELGLAEQSVKEHVSALLRHFGVGNRTALAELAWRSERARLREDFATLLELVPSGVVAADGTGRIVAMNAAALRMMGDRPTVLGTPAARALMGATIVDQVYAFVTGGRPEEVRVRLSARPLRDPDGTIRGAIAVFTAI